MTAVDTNVLVRVLTRDDPRQVPAALDAMRAPRVFVGTTVLLETAWVLKACAGLETPVIRDALRGVAGLPNVVLESPTVVARALAMLDAGLDPADAFHVASAAEADEFVTFDRRLAKAASRVKNRPVVRVPRAAR